MCWLTVIEIPKPTALLLDILENPYRPTKLRYLRDVLPLFSIWLFSMAAFVASNNNLAEDQIDNFLTWTMDQGHEETLAVFMNIVSPADHAFANVLLESAIRIKNVRVLDTLLRCDVKLDSKLFNIASMVGDIGFTKRLLLEADPAPLAGGVGVNLFHCFMEKRHFDLAQLLLDKGV
jgi:hypothetical protein